jgi:hypothetical protein
MKLNNLTSFAYKGDADAEDLRVFLANNQSLETLSLDFMEPGGPLSGPPANLPNLKSIALYFPQTETPSTIFYTPALRNLSSLSVSVVNGARGHKLFVFRAAGDEIALTIKDNLDDLLEVWRDLTEHPRPTIQHIRLENPEAVKIGGLKADETGVMIALFTDAHTLEVGRGYVTGFYPNFIHDLKEPGSRLKTIRFEIPEDTEYGDRSGKLLGIIEDLVKYRFEHGRPFSSVERMVVSESDRVNRLEDSVWRRFYDDRGLGRYIRHE